MIRRSRRTTALLTALAGALALSGATGVVSTASAASAAPWAGSLQAGTIGMPHAMREGRTYYAHTWYRQTSKYRMVASDFFLGVWSWNSNSLRGVSVSWLNPLTHRWQPAKFLAGGYYLGLENDPGLNIEAPGAWARIDFRISFSTAAHTGTWHVMPVVPQGYSLLDARGQGVSAQLRLPADQQFAFTVSR